MGRKPPRKTPVCDNCGKMTRWKVDAKNLRASVACDCGHREKHVRRIKDVDQFIKNAKLTLQWEEYFREQQNHARG